MLFKVVLSEKLGILDDTSTCDVRRPWIGIGLSPYSIITPSAKKQQSIQRVCAITQLADGPPLGTPSLIFPSPGEASSLLNSTMPLHRLRTLDSISCDVAAAKLEREREKK
ncbi:hypothetical protein TNCV_1652471 [Trichonephila clavipes]|nr:hypothetical protein TNCV_1652471 [Trichonephila clavipes]